MSHFFVALAYAFAFTLVVSLPADWAWRRSSRPIAITLAAVNVVGIVAIVYLAGVLDVFRGGWSVVGLVLGIVLAGLAGNALASRLWGSAPWESGGRRDGLIGQVESNDPRRSDRAA
jgi:hypothetical protein